MLGKQVILEASGETRAGCAWFGGLLRVGSCSAAGTLLLHAVDARGQGAVDSLDTGLPFGPTGAQRGQETTALAAWGGRLWIAFGRNGRDWFLTSSADGQAFAPPVALPIEQGFLGPGGMAAHQSGVGIFWTEAFGAKAHLLSSPDGQAFDDTPLPFRANRAPALLHDAARGELLLAYAALGVANTATVFAAAPQAPGVALRALNLPCAGQPGAMALCAGRHHGKDRLHLASIQSSQAGAAELVAHSLAADLSGAGGAEAGGAAVMSVSLAFDGGVCWTVIARSQRELVVVPYIRAFELPPELAAKLGQPCDPSACPEDPRLACMATDEFDPQPFWRPPHIANAVKGDLIMTAGDGRGTIGSMLEQLEPRQTYDHMGIMLADHELVRHCTMAHDRLKRRNPGRFMTGDLVGQKVPSDGFRPDALRYGWPGTLTQTVEDAFIEGRNSWNDATGRPWNAQGDLVALRARAAGQQPAWLPRPAAEATEAQKAAWAEQLGFADPEFPLDEPFPIHNFPQTPPFRPDTGRVLEGLVVKPPPAIEAAKPAIRAMLERIADEAAGIDAHYRFFAYSRAEIAFDPAMVGPAGGWAVGTRPLVCSTFVWAAIEQLRRKGVAIELEGDAAESPAEKPAAAGRDGLYRYDAAERRAAGQGLHDRMVEDVREQVLQALLEMDHEAGAATTIARIGIAGLTALLAGPVAAAAALLVLKNETLSEITTLLNDMPEQLATQMCNTFAFDDPAQTETARWENPGEGVTVSPDDIALFWDAPRGAAGPRLWEGLYGHTEVLRLVPWQPERRRIHVLGRSEGPASLRGRVLYRGQAIAGARLRLGCERTMSGLIGSKEPIYRFDLAAAGRHELQAEAYWPGTTEMLRGRRLVELLPGDNPAEDIELEDPPEWRRLLRVTGTVDLVRKVLIGSDDVAFTPVSMQQAMSWHPAEWGVPADKETRSWVPPPTRSGYAQRFCVVITVKAELKKDLSLEVTVASALCENHFKDGPPPAEKILNWDSRKVTLAPGKAEPLHFDHNSGNFPPDRATVALTVENLRFPA
jgi:hypothetical protein